MKKTRSKALCAIAALLGAFFVIACVAGFAACGGGDNHEHTWDDGVETTAATCTTAGVKTYTCTDCGETKTETIAALGHNWEDIESETNAAATCTEEGSQAVKCSRCDETSTVTIEALGHDLKTTTVDATCTSAGSVTETCSRCDYTNTETIEALGHDLTITTVDATCTTAGSVTETCSRCDYKKTESVAALGHDLVGTYTAGTEGAEGAWTYTCSRCDETFDDTGIDDGTSVAEATLTATDGASLNAAIAWSEAEDAELTVKLSGEMDDETGVPTIALSTPIGNNYPYSSSYSLVIGEDEGEPVKLTLDLNGNTLVCNNTDTSSAQYFSTIIVKATGDLTVIDSVGGGVVDTTGKGASDQLSHTAALYNEGTVTLAGGLFTRSQEAGTDETNPGSGSYYTIENKGDLTIEDGATVFNAGDYSTCIRNKGASADSPATLTINGGKVYGGKYAVGSGSSGYDDEFVMTGGQLGGLRSEDDTLPYRALNNYCNATITGGTLLGGNGGAITANPTKADECVEGVVIFNEDTGTQSLTIGDENGNGPEIIYEGINPNASAAEEPAETSMSYYEENVEEEPAFAAGIALYSGEVDFKGGTIECSDTDAEKDYTFVGVYLTGGKLVVSGGSISGDEALVINCSSDEGASVAATITGGTLSGTIVAYAVTVESLPTNPLTFDGYAAAGYTLTEEKEGDNTTTSRYVYIQGTTVDE